MKKMSVPTEAQLKAFCHELLQNFPNKVPSDITGPDFRIIELTWIRLTQLHLRCIMIYMGSSQARIVMKAPKDLEDALATMQLILSSLPLLRERSHSILCQHYGDKLLRTIR